jgi:hypothetical protein
LHSPSCRYPVLKLCTTALVRQAKSSKKHFFWTQ